MTVEEMRLFLAKTSKTGSVLGLSSMEALCKELGNPEQYGKIIHIAGTNGKGSTGAFVEQALLSLGYKVGRYTSPAVFSYEEIFMINHKPVEPAYLAEIMTEVKNACDRMVARGQDHPTVFEVETAAAFLYFAKEECDFSLIEVGLGGLSDATNVIEKPVVSLITSISRDHTLFLGETITEIAKMKAGIIKDNCAIVKLEQSFEINEVFREKAKATRGGEERLLFAKASDYPVNMVTLNGMNIHDPEWGQFSISMCGTCQQENFACAMECLHILCKQGYIVVDDKLNKMKDDLARMKWPGRFEIIRENPLCIIDGCHNPDAAIKLKDTIDTLLQGRRIHYVIGVLGDKEYEKIFATVLPCGESAVCITPNNARGLAKEELMKVAAEYLSDVSVCDTVKDAMKVAFDQCKDEKDMVLVFGSLSYLGEVKGYVNGLR